MGVNNCCDSRESTMSIQTMITPSRKQYGHMIHGLTLSTLNDVKTAVQQAENQKKEPVYTVDVFRSVVILGKFGSPSMIDVRRALFDLYRADQILADD